MTKNPQKAASALRRFTKIAFYTFGISSLTLLFSGCNPPAPELSILPEPVSVLSRGGVLKVPAELRTGLFNPGQWPDYLQTLITPELNSDIGQEGYRLTVDKKNIRIEAATETGAFYALQSLKQLLEAGEVKGNDILIPCVEINDYPRFEWRGYMLDISRHFFPKEDILAMIDQMAALKLNVLHLHLLDDQGWRIEIKQYPELTNVGAWRVDREEFHWNSREKARTGEMASYGGFLTQDEIREIVSYAASKHIRVVPEIEMPAHVSSAIAAYPWLSCSGKQITVPPGGLWPITDIYCAGKESTFEFLENVLDEVLDLFPSQYIHIGGDEATKTEWEHCALCQKRIREEGLANTEELQSYFIKRIEKYLNEHGRTLIGWDEILEGGLAPNAAVMSWRGVQGGIEAARSGHPVVMSPTSHCYFDYYQGAPELEPQAIGGYLPLQKVYDFEPVPGELNSDEAKMVLGAQANLWTEYVPDLKHAQYMTFPRLVALSEVVWTPSDKRDWKRFTKALPAYLVILENQGVNYAKSVAQVRAETSRDEANNQFIVNLACDYEPAEIRYTLDGSTPDQQSALYKDPIVLNETSTVNAAAFVNGVLYGYVTSETVLVHLASGKAVNYLTKWSDHYAAGGESALTNSLRGSLNHSDGFWQGFEGNDLMVVIDLGASHTVSSLKAGFLQSTGSWIFFPVQVSFELSDDGSVYKSAGTVANDVSPQAAGRQTKDFVITIEPQNARYVKVTAQNLGICPDWHAGAGGKAWLFADEIIIE